MVKLRDDLSNVYKVDASELNLPSVEPDKETKEKALELDRLHDLMRKKLEISKTPEQIQIMTLAPDSWSPGQCAQFFNVSEYIVWTAQDLKKDKGILPKPSPKRGKKLSPK